MKSILIYFSLFFSVPIFVVGQCLDIPGFSKACTATITDCGPCQTWTDACGNGWTRSHGTPEWVPYTYVLSGKEINSFYAYMWSAGSIAALLGEGMFVNLSSGNTFLANHAYSINIRIQTTGGPGTFSVYAANGLSQSPLSSSSPCCGGNTPSISSKQLIGSYTGVTNQWIDVPLSFIANSNYTQLWIYPSASTVTKYNLYVMYVGACLSCDALITYNSGIVPANITQAGIINVGSTAGMGGSGLVTIQSGQTTTLSAKEIDWLPDFQAVVTTGAFSAVINTCGFNGRFTPDSLTMSQIDSINVAVQIPSDESGSSFVNNQVKTWILETEDLPKNSIRHIDIYPSISNGTINISGNADDLKNAAIVVVDQLGRLIFRQKNTSTTDKIKIELNNLSNGLYFIQIRNLFGVVNKKIIINK